MRAIAADTHVTSRILGHLVLKKGTPESEIPRELLEEKAQHYVETVRHLEDTDQPLLGDHVWAEEGPDPQAVVAGVGESGFVFGANTPLLQETEAEVPVEPEAAPTATSG